MTPPLKIALCLPISLARSVAYPPTPLLCRWVTEEIRTTDPMGIPLPLVSSRKAVTNSERNPFSSLIIFRHSPFAHGIAGGKF
jgi:hypothetical protein